MHVLRVPSGNRLCWTMIDGRGDLLADGLHRQIHAGHQHHRLEAARAVARGVRVAGGQRAVVAGVHRLEHVERLARAALTHDDPVGTHAEGVPHQVADRDRALALDVRGRVSSGIT